MREHEWAKDVDKTTRNHVIWLHENKEEVEKFLETVTGNKRVNMNHPTTVRRAYDKVHVVKDKVEKQKKADITEAEHQHLLEKIERLQEVIEDGEFAAAKPETSSDADGDIIDASLKASLTAEAKRLRDQLFDAEQEIVRLKARIAEVEGTPTAPTKPKTGKSKATKKSKPTKCAASKETRYLGTVEDARQKLAAPSR
jgi:hypothetical protein